MLAEAAGFGPRRGPILYCAERIGIGDIVHLEPDALGADLRSDRVRIEGEMVALCRSTVQTLALAIHELATNARKYGGLPGEDGRLAIRRETYVTDAGRLRLRFAWTETGIACPVETTGDPVHEVAYGRKLIEEALSDTPTTVTTYRWGPDRLGCGIDRPLEP